MRLAVLTAVAVAGLTAGDLKAGPLKAASLKAGAAKVDVTHPGGEKPNGPLFVRALVLDDGTTSAVLVSVDAVAIGEIGPIKNDYLPQVRQRLQQELKIPPAAVFVNATHCHGVVCDDVAERTVQAVKEAWARRSPAAVGAGRGREDRIAQNRRVALRDGRQADIRRAYSDPPDALLAAVGPIDPEIGLLRVDRADGSPLAVVFNYACHPIQGCRHGGNSADLTGVAAAAIEKSWGPDAVALFVQGCAGDLNPIGYKQTAAPADGEPLGGRLALSALAALRRIECRGDATLATQSRTIALPRGDNTARIARLRALQSQLLARLQPTTLNLKSFLPLAVQHGLWDAYPAQPSYGYRHDEALGRADWRRLDEQNRKHLDAYVNNVMTMEELTRLKVNLALLEKHQAANAAAASRSIDVEVGGLRAGEFRLVTFPGELSVEIGLGIKRRATGGVTCVAGYTNGYIYYAPTEKQLLNTGYAQEDCDCRLGAGWQAIFEKAALETLGSL